MTATSSLRLYSVRVVVSLAVMALDVVTLVAASQTWLNLNELGDHRANVAVTGLGRVTSPAYIHDVTDGLGSATGSTGLWIICGAGISLASAMWTTRRRTSPVIPVVVTLASALTMVATSVIILDRTRLAGDLLDVLQLTQFAHALDLQPSAYVALAGSIAATAGSIIVTVISTIQSRGGRPHAITPHRSKLALHADWQRGIGERSLPPQACTSDR